MTCKEDYGYKLCSPEMLVLLDDINNSITKKSRNCTGMYSFSFYPQKLTFLAHLDTVVPFYEVIV